MIYRAFHIQYRWRYLFWEYFIVFIVWLTASFTLFSLLHYFLIFSMHKNKPQRRDLHKTHCTRPFVSQTLTCAGALAYGKCLLSGKNVAAEINATNRESRGGVCVWAMNRALGTLSNDPQRQIRHLSVYSGCAQCTRASINANVINDIDRPVYLISCPAC